MSLSSYKVEKLTEAAQPAVSVCDLKDQVSITDSDYDEMLEAFELAAREYVQKATGQILTQNTYRIYLDDFPVNEFYFPNGPVTAIASIEYRVGGVWTAVSTDVYKLGAGELVSQGVSRLTGKDWPTGKDIECDSVRIDYAAGAENRIGIQIIKLLVSHWFENREAVGPTNLKSLPFAVQALIDSIKSYNVR